MLWLWSSLAFAGGFGVQATWPLGFEPVAIVALGDVAAVSGLDQTVLVGASGELGRAARGGVGLAAWDVRGDGVSDVIVCARDGLFVVDRDASGLGAIEAVTVTPCEAVVAHDLAGGGIAAGGEDLVLYQPGAGWPAEAAGWSSGARPALLAARPGGLAAATIGGSEVWMLGAAGAATVDVGEPIAGLAAASEGYAVSAYTSRSAGPIGALVPVGGIPGDLASGDFDGDGAIDVAAIVGARVLLLLAAGGEPEAVDVEGAIALGAGDLDADGCAEAAVGTAAGDLVVVGALACGDADGDGWTIGRGDCDDRDPARHPGAAEACDGDDDDCDGAADEPGVWISGPPTIEEGATVVYSAAPDGCDADPDATIAWSASGAACVVAGAEAECIAADQGELALAAVASDADGAPLASGSLAVVVLNVAPRVIGPDAVVVVGDAIRADGRCGEVIALQAHDPGDDTWQFFGIVDGDGAFVLPDGALYGDVTLADEDGGERRYVLDAFGRCGLDTARPDTGWPDPADTAGDDTGRADLGCGAEEDEDEGCDDGGSPCCWLVLLILGLARRGVGLGIAARL